jgi:nitrite reductase/ring-hydroxylating ferredoxin subunit
MEWIDAGKAEKIPDNTMTEISAGTIAILLVKSNGQFFAVAATCPHHSAWFIQGRIDGPKLHCPRHMGIFDMRTGQLLSGPTCPALPIYTTKLLEGRVLIKAHPSANGETSSDIDSRRLPNSDNA